MKVLVSQNSPPPSPSCRASPTQPLTGKTTDKNWSLPLRCVAQVLVSPVSPPEVPDIIQHSADRRALRARSVPARERSPWKRTHKQLRHSSARVHAISASRRQVEVEERLCVFFFFIRHLSPMHQFSFGTN